MAFRTTTYLHQNNTPSPNPIHLVEQLPEIACHHQIQHQATSRVVPNSCQFQNQIPPDEIVDQLFEKLLSIRVFPNEALYSLKKQPVERKWELLLREHETNHHFDLKNYQNKLPINS